MSFPRMLKIAVFADVVTDGIKKTYDTNNRYYRVGQKLSEMFSIALGFNYTLLPSVDGQFGKLLPDGNWTGMIGMVHRGEADMAISEIAVTEKRRKVVNYSYPFSIIDVTFITQKPDRTSDLTTIFEPFAFEVWIALSICHLIMPFAFYFLFRRRYSFAKVVLQTFGTFLGQQIFKSPRRSRLSQRILLTSWMLSMMVLSYIYKAHLLSTLTFPTLKGVKHIDELSAEVEKGTYECETYAGSFYADELLKSPDKSFLVIGGNLDKNPGSSDVKKVMSMYRKSAFIGPKPDFMHLKNKYFVSNDVFFSELPSIVMRKDFCCGDKFNEVIFRLNAGGLYQKILKDESFALIVDDFADLAYPSDEGITPLTLNNLQSAFLFAGVGYIVSILVFAVEMTLGFRNRKPIKKKRRRSRIKIKKRTKTNDVLVTKVIYTLRSK